MLVIKPEDFTVEPPEEHYNAIEGVVEFSMFLGSFTQLRMSVANQNLKVFIDPKKEVKPGSKFVIYVKVDDVLVFPRSEEGILEIA